MKRNVITDERIEIEKMKIASASFGILVLGIVVDIFYKMYSNSQFNSFKGELLILIVAGVFYVCEASRKGIIELYSNEAGRRGLKIKYVVVNIVLALSYAAVDIAQGSVKTNADKLGLSLGVITFILLGIIIDLIIMKKSNKI